MATNANLDLKPVVVKPKPFNYPSQINIHYDDGSGRGSQTHYAMKSNLTESKHLFLGAFPS